MTGRSMNAEIVARIEAYDALHFRIGELAEEKEKLTAQLDATRDALAEQKKISVQLQQLIHMQSEDAQRDQETENVITEKFNELKEQSEYLETLKAEILRLHKELEAEQAEERRALKDQETLLSRIEKSERTATELLKSFRTVFRKAADGNDDELKKIVAAFQALDERDD